MKKIDLNLVIKKDNSSNITKRKKHRIIIDWGTSVYFSDYQNAQKYLSRFNDYMDRSAFELNNIFAKLMYIYRVNWMYQSYSKDNEVVDIMNHIINEFFRMFKTKNRGTSGGIYIQPSFKQLNTLMIDYCNSILKYSLRASDSPIFREIAMFKHQIDSIYAEYDLIIDPGKLGELVITEQYYSHKPVPEVKVNLNGKKTIIPLRKKTIRLNGGKKVPFVPMETTKKRQPALPVGVRKLS